MYISANFHVQSTSPVTNCIVGKCTINYSYIVHLLATQLVVGEVDWCYTLVHTHYYITITNSIFTDNTIGSGGGLVIKMNEPINILIQGVTIITNSTATKNRVNGPGGGLVIESSSIGTAYNNSILRITITNSIFTDNTNGGGLVIDIERKKHNVIITNSTFTKNTVEGGGGGVPIKTIDIAHNNNNLINLCEAK